MKNKKKKSRRKKEKIVKEIRKEKIVKEIRKENDKNNNSGKIENLLEIIEALNNTIRILQDSVLKILEKNLRKAKIKNGHNKNKHHIIPRSRGGKSTPDNISKVEIYLHALYHELFKNMTPREIIKYLNKYFWNNNYIISIKKSPLKEDKKKKKRKK